MAHSTLCFELISSGDSTPLGLLLVTERNDLQK